MRLNGLYIVADLAIRELDHPLVTRYRAPLVLGSLREDVWYVPALRIVFEHLSFSHFYKPGKPGGLVPFLWPGPRMKAEKFYGRAVRMFRDGDRAASFVQLGRVVHLLTDMCCPVHAHRTVHETDPFEWYVEGNKKKLLAMPVPKIDDAPRASDLIEGMARFTQDYATDETNHGIGRLMKKLGVWKSVSSKEAGAQARALIPTCAGYTVSLFRLFLRDVGVALAEGAAAAA
jgi:hypothetical protein